ncbi:MAG TPA: hypothetical protein DCE42_26920 [Myxococcales bacterium]|nr:hypothetical protein [Deltaproteobacteria bacterium]MBU50384.1 hypothetical protein [Deltaproteobacteria bacterium]HAA58425.1 hypothetical protein [Myxococcales bacterium]
MLTTQINHLSDESMRHNAPTKHISVHITLLTIMFFLQGAWLCCKGCIEPITGNIGKDDSPNKHGVWAVLLGCVTIILGVFVLSGLIAGIAGTTVYKCWKFVKM